MQTTNYVATVKERGPGEPCFVLIELHEDIGLRKQRLIFDLPKGTDIIAAQTLARALNASPRPSLRVI